MSVKATDELYKFRHGQDTGCCGCPADSWRRHSFLPHQRAGSFAHRSRSVDRRQNAILICRCARGSNCGPAAWQWWLEWAAMPSGQHSTAQRSAERATKPNPLSHPLVHYDLPPSRSQSPQSCLLIHREKTTFNRLTCSPLLTEIHLQRNAGPDRKRAGGTDGD